MTAPVIEAVGTAQIGSAVQALEVNPVGGIVNGNLLLIFGLCDEEDDLTLNEPGWTREKYQQATSGTDLATAVWSKIAASETGSDYTMNIDGGINRVLRANMIRISGHDPTANGMDAVATGADTGANSDTHATPAIDTATVDALVLSYLGLHQVTGSDRTQPSGYNEDFDVGGLTAICLASKTVTSPSTETPGTWSGCGTGAEGCGITLAIKPAGAVGGGLPDYHGTNRGIMRGVARGIG